MENRAGVFIVDGITLPKEVKFRRVLRDLRQSDLAYLATEWLKDQGLPGKVTPPEISWLEQGWRPSETHEKAICAVLGIQGYER